MEHWQNATAMDLQRFAAISRLFTRHSKLLGFFFNIDKPELQWEPEEMLRIGRGFSSGERLLLRVGLDIWNGSGSVKIEEILDVLDEDNFCKTLEALTILRRGITAN